jgi:class 3 adenylate cyclase
VPWLGDAAAPVFFLVGAGFSVALLVLGTRAFLRADPIGRRQIKWALYGVYVGFVPVLATSVLGTLGLVPWRAQEVATIAIALAPLCGFIAIVRFDLFDIDRLISTTAAYSVLSVVLSATALVLVPRLSAAITTSGSFDPVVGQSAFALLLAGAVIPARRYLRPQIERVFFAERHALERGIERVLRELSTCAGPEALLRMVGERLDALVRPECCVVYGRAGDTYVPVFVRGRVVPASLEADSAVVRELHARGAPLDVTRWRQRHGRGLLRPADLAALDSVGAAVLLPVTRREMLTAFVSLGEKRSGDVYTATDLVLLAALADKTANELERFDQAEIGRQARAMQDALRRYVPEPIAARVVSGEDLDLGEREISVLFVDLRGYTTYSEDRTAVEVFSTINRYTAAVSRVIRRHGGTVVEFNGDGMMAVFGAPEVLAQKERAAIEAGCEVIAAVRALELGGARPLDVGVGIATGRAFVGNIRSADRWIWSAIGNTPNLAARLQALTRELRAAIAVDAVTWSAAGPLAASFDHRPQVPIRGRRQTEDVYVLPLGTGA